MGKVQDALQRLEAAVARLERVSHHAANGEAQLLAAARADYAALADTTDAVAQRLDAVIGRLDRVLEG